MDKFPPNTPQSGTYAELFQFKYSRDNLLSSDIICNFHTDKLTIENDYFYTLIPQHSCGIKVIAFKHGYDSIFFGWLANVPTGYEIVGYVILVA